uniref:Uncharacterized protein n=1 Tax=Daucus carota subsp. sativus TaxID=79200 RepID=A0A175YKD7_DAUCS
MYVNCRAVVDGHGVDKQKQGVPSQLTLYYTINFTAKLRSYYSSSCKLITLQGTTVCLSFPLQSHGHAC